MSAPHVLQKQKVAPGDPKNPRPGYGRVKPHFLVAGLVTLALGLTGKLHFIGSLLLGILFLTWAIDNEYFDFE